MLLNFENITNNIVFVEFVKNGEKQKVIIEEKSNIFEQKIKETSIFYKVLKKICKFLDVSFLTLGQFVLTVDSSNPENKIWEISFDMNDLSWGHLSSFRLSGVLSYDSKETLIFYTSLNQSQDSRPFKNQSCDVIGWKKVYKVKISNTPTYDDHYN